MSAEEHASPAAMTRVLAARTDGPRWRGLLEARLQVRLREVTELSLAYHAAAVPDGCGHEAGQPQEQALLCRAVAARRKLADVEEALNRLAAGHFGCCEQCGSPIPAGVLAIVPEARYCPGCDIEPARPGRGPR